MIRVIALLATCALLADAQPPPVRAEWNRIPEVLAGKEAVVHLHDGTKIQGTWISVTSDAFTFLIERTSAKDKHPKGQETIPRSAVRIIEYRSKRIRGRVIGILAGFYSIAGIGAAATGSGEALQGGWGIAAIAGAAGGYFIGKSVDKQTRVLEVDPPPLDRR